MTPLPLMAYEHPKPAFCTVERIDNGYLVTYIDVVTEEQTPPPQHREPPKDETEKLKRAVEQAVVGQLNHPRAVHRRVFCKTPTEVCEYADRACAAYEEARRVVPEIIFCG